MASIYELIADKINAIKLVFFSLQISNLSSFNNLYFESIKRMRSLNNRKYLIFELYGKFSGCFS